MYRLEAGPWRMRAAGSFFCFSDVSLIHPSWSEGRGAGGEKRQEGKQDKSTDNSDTLYVWYVCFFRNTEAELKKGVSS